ncbi:MAG: sigma 54-interacting transcriptional regulator [Melioribacteraceae bacterium]
MEKFRKEYIAQIKGLTKEQFEALEQISLILNTATYKDSLIESVLDLIIDVVNAERGLFANIENEQFEIISARNVEKEKVEDLSEFSSSLIKRILETKKSMVYHDVQSDPNLSQFESVMLHNIKSVLGVPIKKDEDIWGIILVDSTKNRKEFSDENLLFLNFLSNLISLSLEKIINLEALKDENEILKNQVQSVNNIPEMIGDSKPMLQLSKLVTKVAVTDATVLITGESGTGKELVAKAIHKLSDRVNNTFIAQFCGSIPDTLLESELFGYKKGAFTGATKDKKGLLEITDKGTFFLDEIADISPSLQAKLLRVIENKEIIMLGDTKVKSIDVRIIAATNKNLNQLVKEGKFREDLLYRLNVFPIKLPTLAERVEDIALLVKDFLSKINDRQITVESKTLKLLESYSWPGNVRQLHNVLKRAVILCEGNKLTSEHIIIEEWDSTSLENSTIKNMERQMLKERLEKFSGNKKLTAQSLGVSVRWIQLKLKEDKFLSDE